MARNGSGTFNRLYDWTDDAAAGVNIRADKMDAEMDGMATALSESVARDGQTTITANLPMSGFRHTGVSDGQARDDYAAVGQAQDGEFVWGGTSGGTADAQTISLSPVITAYTDGLTVRFTAGATNTGAMTLNVDSVGATNVKMPDGTDPGAGAVTSGNTVEMVYDGTNFVLMGVGTTPASGRDFLGLGGSATADFASQAEAEAGTDNTVGMTPLRTQQWGDSNAVQQGKHTIWLPAVVWREHQTSAPEESTFLASGADQDQLPTWNFDPASDEYVYTNLWMPDSWDGGTVTFKIIWGAGSTSADVVLWKIAGYAYADGDGASSGQIGTEQEVTDAPTGNSIMHSAETPAVTLGGSPSAGELVTLRLRRNAGNGSDTLSVDAKLIGVVMYYTVNAADDS